jgi:hypothetical protein
MYNLYIITYIRKLFKLVTGAVYQEPPPPPPPPPPEEPPPEKPEPPPPPPDELPWDITGDPIWLVIVLIVVLNVFINISVSNGPSKPEYHSGGATAIDPNFFIHLSDTPST